MQSGGGRLVGWGTQGKARREDGRVLDLLDRRIGRPTALLVSLAALVTLWWWSAPGGGSMAVVAVLGMGWMGLGAYWFLRLMGALGAGGFKRVISDGMWWAFPPAVVVLTIFLVLANAPLRLRFELSQGSLERYARESIAEPNVTHPARLGLYRIRKVQRFDGGVRLLTSECMSDLCGFAYSPEGEPPKGRGENHFVHLEGPWYLWEQSW